MESQGEIYISSRYKKEDYLSLELAINSNSSKWSKAVDILKDRINGRFFAQIDLLSENVKNNGFAIMALNCLLIETLFQFQRGLNRTPSTNKEHYALFLCSAFPNDFVEQHIGERFYEEIRCGILHSAQTKGESRLSDNYSNIAARIEDGVLVVSVARVTEILKTYFDDYSNKLLDPTESNLRKSFVKKMGFVCRT